MKRRSKKTVLGRERSTCKDPKTWVCGSLEDLDEFTVVITKNIRQNSI